MTVRRVASQGLVLLISILALSTLSCGDDEMSGPPPDFTISITESNFQQFFQEVNVGQTVEWQNVWSRTRTVTSGLGPDDPEAGLDFDEDLAGYRSGNAVGGRFRLLFTEADTIHYFSRFGPEVNQPIIGGTFFVIP